MNQYQKRTIILNFVRKIKEMRLHQKSFISERSNSNKKTAHLNAAKELELEVDQLLTNFNITEDNFTYRISGYDNKLQQD